MKLVRFGRAGEEKPGLLTAEGQIRDLSGVVSEIHGTTLSAANLEKLRSLDPHSLPLVEGEPRLGACVAGVGKFICIGLNYSDHAAESGMSVPAEPVVFMKATSAIMGPNDDVVIPRGSEKTDWEVELGVVIGKTAKYVKQEDALSHVAGYCVVNDLSERASRSKAQGSGPRERALIPSGRLDPGW